MPGLRSDDPDVRKRAAENVIAYVEYGGEVTPEIEAAYKAAQEVLRVTPATQAEATAEEPPAEAQPRQARKQSHRP